MQEVLRGDGTRRFKKLIEAAEHWARGGPPPVDEQYLKDLKRFGASDEVIAAQRSEEEREAAPFEVYPENWPTVLAFKTMQRQWNLVAVEGEMVFTGLRYEAIGSVMVMVGAKQEEQQNIMLGLHVMEAAAVVILNERVERDG